MKPYNKSKALSLKENLNKYNFILYEPIKEFKI